jgi:hypothetical protein
MFADTPDLLKARPDDDAPNQPAVLTIRAQAAAMLEELERREAANGRESLATIRAELEGDQAAA